MHTAFTTQVSYLYIRSHFQKEALFIHKRQKNYEKRMRVRRARFPSLSKGAFLSS